ncbi:MAG: redoxin domain-containing protein [Flavobacteriales bacterium]
MKATHTMKYFTKGMLAILILTSFTASAQQNLKFKITGLTSKDTVYLAGYYGKNLMYADTAITDNKGIAVFNKKKHPGGMYAFVYGGRYFDLLVDVEEVYIESSKENLIADVKVIKSKENIAFYKYIGFIAEKKKVADDLNAKLKAAAGKAEEEKPLKAQLKAIDEEVKKYQKDLIANNPELLAAKVLKSSLDVELPEPPKNADGSLKDSLWAYKFMRAHFFDNIDFCDDRLLRTPFFHPRMENFFKNMVHPIPDSVSVAAEWLLHKTECGPEFFKYTVTHLTYTYETSKIMCMDAVFVHLVNIFYRTGRVTWLSKEKLEKVLDRAKKLEPILCQKEVHNLSLLDTAGTAWKRLYDVKADYTILIFWDPDCGHCKKEMPKFVELYKKMKSKGVTVYAVSQEHSAAWKKFIKEQKMEEFINVGVPGDIYKEKGQEKAHEYVRKGFTDYISLNYRDHFDIYATPKIFLLDKNKKIIAKYVEAEQMEKILDFHMKQQGKQK